MRDESARAAASDPTESEIGNYPEPRARRDLLPPKHAAPGHIRALVS
jgi:hypothetical protein